MSMDKVNKRVAIAELVLKFYEKSAALMRDAEFIEAMKEREAYIQAGYLWVTDKAIKYAPPK